MGAREQKQLSRSSEPSRRRLQRRRGPWRRGRLRRTDRNGQAANLVVRGAGPALSERQNLTSKRDHAPSPRRGSRV